LREKLKKEIISLINNGVVYFGAGSARGFDLLAAQTILELKRSYPQIRLILILPCEHHTKYWKKEEKLAFGQIKEKADKIKVLSKEYYPGCMHDRNKYMAEHSSVCVCYYRKKYGGTDFTLRYAKEQGLRIIEL